MKKRNQFLYAAVFNVAVLSVLFGPPLLFAIIAMAVFECSYWEGYVGSAITYWVASLMAIVNS